MFTIYFEILVLSSFVPKFYGGKEVFEFDSTQIVGPLKDCPKHDRHVNPKLNTKCGQGCQMSQQYLWHFGTRKA